MALPIFHKPGDDTVNPYVIDRVGNPFGIPRALRPGAQSVTNHPSPAQGPMQAIMRIEKRRARDMAHRTLSGCSRVFRCEISHAL